LIIKSNKFYSLRHKNKKNTRNIRSKRNVE
jgi:hypothetical protein